MPSIHRQQPSARINPVTAIRIGLPVGLLLLLALILQTVDRGTPAAEEPLQTPRSDQPNIILIMTDDQSVDTVAYMPTVQRELVAKGRSFTRSYVTSPLCCPSRTSILRGQYVHNHRVLTNYPPLGGFDRIYASGLETSTVATWLQAAGYQTVLIGKYANRYPLVDNPTYIPPGWNDWYAWWDTSTPEAYYTAFRVNENGTTVDYGPDDGAYTTDVFGAQAVAYLQRAADPAAPAAPFLMVLSLLAPHAPAIPAERHASALSDLELPVPPSFDEADVSDKPRWIQEKTRLTEAQISNITQNYRDHVRTLLAADEVIAAVIDTLTTTGLLDNTYIIFYSDNGSHRGIHRMTGGKGTAYTEDVLVPLIVRGPGVPPDTTSDQIVANIDLAPTFADLAGATVPDFVDGRSLVPLLRGDPVADWRQALLITYLCPEFNGEPEFIDDKRGEPCFNSLRTATYAYTHYPVSNEQELYNLVDDPYQLENLANAGDPVIRKRLTRYDAAMRDLLQCEGEVCRQLELTALE